MQRHLRGAVAALACACASAQAEDAALLLYQVWEPLGEPYLSRILVTPTRVRLDEGEAGLGYTLLDREQDIVYNVSDQDRSVLVINPATAPGPLPADLVLGETSRVSESAPAVDGRLPREISLDVNGEPCRQVVAVEALMPAALEGLRDFNRVMARVQAATLPRMPVQFRSDCDLVELVYAPDRWLSYGLPVEDRYAGRRQQLLHYEPVTEADARLFEVPPDYRRTAMPGIAGP